MGATSLREMVDEALAVDPDGDEWLPLVGRLRDLDDQASFDAIVALTASTTGRAGAGGRRARALVGRPGRVVVCATIVAMLPPHER